MYGKLLLVFKTKHKMKRTRTIKNVQLFLKLALGVTCIQLAFITLSYTVNLFDNSKFFGGLLQVNASYTLNNEQMEALQESGYNGCVRITYPNNSTAKSLTGINYSSKNNKLAWKYEYQNSGDCQPQSIAYTYGVTSKSFTGLMLFLFKFIKTLLIGIGIYLLHQVLSNTLKVHPFVKENSSKLSWIAYLLFGFAFLDWLYRDIFLDLAKAVHLSAGEKWSIGFNTEKISFTLLLLGFLVLIISSIFKYGYQLKAENDLTI